MNTTHSVSEPAYTIIGKPLDFPASDAASAHVSLLLLGEGARFQRREMFEKLVGMEWAEIISVESPNPSYDYESLNQRFPGLRFLLFADPEVNLGMRINIAIRECRSNLVCLLWSSMVPLPLPGRVVQESLETNSVVTLPLLRNPRGEVFPSVSIPAHYRQGMKTLFVVPGVDHSRSIFPFEYTGLYRRDLFLSMGGYDTRIRESYWQKMDFGFRSYLWGMEIPVSTHFRVQYSGDFEPEDTSAGPGYLRFYLKNFLPEFKADHSELEKKEFWAFYRRSGLGFFSARSLFREIRRWVRDHKYRFESDARKLIEMWDEEKIS